MGQNAMLFGLAVVWIFLLWIQVAYNITCIRRACDEVNEGEDNAITCNQSLILVSDVTNYLLERDKVAFENMKRACMGKSSCDPSRVCDQGKENKRTLVVHYFCVDANLIRSKSCNRRAENVNWESGYIQSPAYPAAMLHYQPCTWRIEAPHGSVVVLSLHDIAISGTQEECNGGLKVTGNSCDGEGHMFAPRLLCGGDNENSLMRCGKVDIELAPSQQVYPLRFWLSFHVHPKYQPSNLRASMLPCSGWIYSMETGLVRGGQADVNIETTQLPTEITETNTELLIIMLSVISGISVVLLVILIIVCVRCRLLQSPHGEHVYCDPSPSLQAHYEYISSLESEKPRPQLADGYFEVADALPITQRGETPTSPAYAEVEQFPQLRKAHLSPSGEESPKGMKPPAGELKSSENDSKSAGEKMKSVGIEPLKAKRGVLVRLKADKRVEKERKALDRYSTGPKVIEASIRKDWGNNQECTDAPLPQSNTDDDSSCTYEQIEEFSPIKQSPNKADRKPPKLPSHPCPPKLARPNAPPNGDGCTKTVNRVKDSARIFTEKSSDAQPKSYVPNKSPNNMTSTLKKGSTSTNSPASLAERSKTLPHKHSKGSGQTAGMTNNNYKRAAYKDVPRTRGIVKNGIQKFEQSSSVS